jgi:hypothetical protein
MFALSALLLVVAAMTACSESATPQATGKGSIRGMNAIVTAPALAFLIEERTLANVDYKDATAFNSFDDLTYNFNFDLSLPGQIDRVRVATRFVDVLADHEYTVVLTGSIAEPSTLFWEDPAREWAEGETVTEVFFAHLAPQVGELDVYFATPGTVPVLGQAVGSLANGERLPGQDFEADEYELILTAKDDPASIVYQSVPFTVIAQTRVTIAVFDPDPTLRGNVGVNLISPAGGSARITDVNFPRQLRALHAAFGTENFDGYFDSNFADLIYSDVGFKALSQYADVIESPLVLTLTPVGNSGATIHEGELAMPPGTGNTVVLAGQPGALTYLGLPDNGRPVETYPLVRITNGSFNTELLDIYLVEQGTSIEDVVIPQFPALPSQGNTTFSATEAGRRELTVTLRAEKTPVATPVVVDLAIGDAVDIIIVDTVDPAVLETVVFDFQPAP